MTDKQRFKHLLNGLGMQFIYYDDKEVLMGTFADRDGVAHIVELLNELAKENQLNEERISLLSSLIDLADAIIDTSDNEKAKSVWENKNEDFEKKWEELND